MNVTKKLMINLLVLSILFVVACLDIRKTSQPDGCTDFDGDGYCSVVTGGDDCNDSDPDIHPGADEICGDLIDQNCDRVDLKCEDCDNEVDDDGDGRIDCGDSDCEDDPACTECVDEDEDGFCAVSDGGDDCDDDDADVHPGATEIPGDGIDQDCDGRDEEVEREEICDDGIDNDHDSLIDCRDPDCVGTPECTSCTDSDGDGHCSVATGGDDCNDANASVHPGATEICDSIDNDCDGSVDEGGVCGCSDCDGDGYDSVSSGGSDCNDANASVHPGATEICDSIDNDCDGSVDEGGVCGSLTELNCSNGLDDDSDGRIDCADSDCYGLSGCPIPGSEACYRFTYRTPSGQLASSIRVDGTYCLPTYGCSSWFMPLHDTATPANTLEVSSSSVLTGTLRLEAGADFEVNVRSMVMGLEHWYCSYGASRVPPAEHYGTLTVEESADCSTGWSTMALYDHDLGSGTSDCNVRTWL